MEFDGIDELQTGSSIKKSTRRERAFEQHHEHHESMRVTTTEAQDIFDEDELWNMSGNWGVAYNDPTVSARPISQCSDVRANPQEEYFRLVSVRC